MGYTSVVPRVHLFKEKFIRVKEPDRLPPAECEVGDTLPLEYA
jgi:hypothetical protein